MWDLARRSCRLTPDWRHYLVRVSEDELHIELEQNWVVISYPEVIHRLKCTIIKKLVPRHVEVESTSEETHPNSSTDSGAKDKEE